MKIEPKAFLSIERSMATAMRAGWGKLADQILPQLQDKLAASASQLILSRLNGWPIGAPADASPPASRPTTHGLGPMWFAIPSS